MNSCSFSDETPPLVLVPDQVIDGISQTYSKDWKILIEDGLIRKVGQDISIPNNAEIISLEGTTVLPGFIDMHGHLYVNNGTKVQNEPSYLKLYLAGGVTTIFSPGEYEPYKTLEYKRAIERGDMEGPEVLTAGPYFDEILQTLDRQGNPIDKRDFRAFFEKWQNNIDEIKIYTGNSESEVQYLVQKADSLGILVTAHLGNVTAKRAVELGVDGLEHGLYAMPEFGGKYLDTGKKLCEIAKLYIKGPEVQELIDIIVENNVYISPTIITFQSLMPNFEPDNVRWQTYLSESTQKNVTGLMGWQKSMMGDSNCWSRALEKQNRFLEEFHKRGGTIVTGTDPVGPVILPGFALHSEILNLVEAGLTPMDAIKAATINGARALDKEAEIGSIEKGKRANFVVVQGNPAENIEDIKNVVMVFKKGEKYDPKKLRDSVKGKVGTGRN